MGDDNHGTTVYNYGTTDDNHDWRLCRRNLWRHNWRHNLWRHNLWRHNWRRDLWRRNLWSHNWRRNLWSPTDDNSCWWFWRWCLWYVGSPMSSSAVVKHSLLFGGHSSRLQS